MKTRVLSALALLVFACFARAETNFGECIEWAVADSERVVVGKITKVEKSGKYEIATVAVSKTFRGKHEDKLQFVLPWSDGHAEGWRKANVPMLFCLVKRDQIKDNKDLPERDLFLRYGAGHHSVVFLGKTDQQGMDVFTRDFGELTDPAAILKHVEAYAKTIPADWKRKHIVINLPFGNSAMKKLYGGSAVIFTLPADATLETQGKGWCKSRDPDLRERGVRALAAFPNEENIKILKGLLTDDAFSTGDGKKHYYIRARAYDALRELGLKVERPVLEESAK
jgi:hypothetical protein